MIRKSKKRKIIRKAEKDNEIDKKRLLREIISSIAGVNATKIVDLLYGKKNVNEFLIAKKLNLTINQTRNILYKLADEGLVSFVRKKDKKKGGWYTYFWTLSSGRSLFKLRDRLLKEIESLRIQLDNRKNRRFFFCENCHIEYTEEVALINGYVCPECGQVLKLKDNREEIGNNEKQISKLENALNEVNKEIGLVAVAEEKIRIRKAKNEVKKKEKIRLEKKKEREKAAKKEKTKLKKSKNKKRK